MTSSCTLHIKDAVTNLVRSFAPEKIILFGSAAQGKFGPERIRQARRAAAAKAAAERIKLFVEEKLKD